MRALLIEDNPGDARLLREMLRDAVLDLMLADSSGLETFDRLHAAAPSTPVVVLSGLADESIAINAVHHGAQNYLVKGQWMVVRRVSSRVCRMICGHP